MDLRPFGLSAEFQKIAAKILDYQPFIISDDVQTGVAYSWFYVKDVESVALDSVPLVLDRSQAPSRQWEEFVAINARLRRMYDDWIRLLADRYPGGRMLDVACNNGYFPVQAELCGMGPSLGIDIADYYARSIGFLNTVCGTHAGFVHAPYDFRRHVSDVTDKFDVVVASNILPHLPDPTHFISFLGGMAREAVLLWTGVLDTPELLVRYMRPVSHWGKVNEFPHSFNRGTLVSRGLIEYAFEAMGFRNLTWLPWSPEWIPDRPEHAPPPLPDDAPPAAKEGYKLVNEMRHGLTAQVVLATR